ncbi:MAG: FkbM family methyltransferase [Rikenellaceae bacterium]
MNKLIHKFLYKILPLRTYLRVVSGMLFLLQRLGYGRQSEMLEYIYHLEKLLSAGDVAIDIGANLGYYSRTMARIVGAQGHVYSVEPVIPIFDTLRYNTRKFRNITLYNIALGTEERSITMANNTVASEGYFCTGQNFVQESAASDDEEFSATMKRGSELFAQLTRLDLIKCDIEGYEVVVLNEMRSIIERHRPVILLESGGEKRQQMIELFVAELGYTAYTLVNGVEIALSKSSEKDIIFRP